MPSEELKSYYHLPDGWCTLTTEELAGIRVALDALLRADSHRERLVFAGKIREIIDE